MASDAPTLDKIAIGAFIAAIVTAAVAGALPAVWWDPIAYHLPIAARALTTGVFSFDPTMTQTAFPLLGEAAALPAYAIGGSAGAALVTLGSGIVLAVLCAAIARGFDPNAAWLGAALVATSPLWAWLAPSFYVDVPFATFAVAAIGAPLVLTSRAARPTNIALVAGTFAGSAAAVKLTGVGVIIVAGVVAVLAARREWRWSVISFLIGAAALALPWYARSAIVAGDPAYPFLSPLLHPGSAVADFSVRYATMTRNWCGGGYGAADLLLLPWRMMTNPRFYCGDPGYALRLGIVLFAVGVAWVRSARIPALIALGFTGLWFLESHQDRFLVPALAFYAIAVAVAARRIAPRLGAAIAVLLIALGTLAVVENWIPGFEYAASNSVVPAYQYMSGRMDARQYLSARLESYAAADWFRTHTRANERIFALDDVRDYYFGPNVVWGNPFYQAVWDIDWHAKPSVRYAALRAAGFRFMVVNAYRAYVERTPTGIDWRVLQQDQADGALRPVFQSDDVTVYELAAPR